MTKAHHASRYLSPRAMRGIDRLGTVLLPGDGDLPRFSATGCVAQVDRVVAYVPADDRKDLAMVLGIFGLLPTVLVRALWFLFAHSGRVPTGLGALLRFARFGLKGLINTLYFDDPTVLAAIGYDVDVYVGDLEPAPQLQA
jgi:hypothetical protein